jgi:hypothetical protein
MTTVSALSLRQDQTVPSARRAGVRRNAGLGAADARRRPEEPVCAPVSDVLDHCRPASMLWPWHRATGGADHAGGGPMEDQLDIALDDVYAAYVRGENHAALKERMARWDKQVGHLVEGRDDFTSRAFDLVRKGVRSQHWEIAAEAIHIFAMPPTRAAYAEQAAAARKAAEKRSVLDRLRGR